MRAAVAALSMLLAAASAAAGQTASGWFPVPTSALYQTGDSWTERGVTYRLYGVQSCLRGTTFTNAHGVPRDCGEASLAMLVALTRDLRPQCYAAAEIAASRTVFVFCIAQPSAGAGAGSRIDLGTALVASGFAFAALTPEGSPVHAPYLAAQQVAQRARVGLWAFADMPEPNAIIARALRTGGQAAAETSVSVTSSSAPSSGTRP